MVMNYRNYLSLALAVIVIPGLWVCQGTGVLELPGAVIGATISIETLIGQFYFRKAKVEA